ADAERSESQSLPPPSSSVERSEPQTIHPPSGRVERSEGRAVPQDALLISVVMPCLNESRTLAACITEARAGCQAALISRNALAPGSGISRSALAHSPLNYEILIADNGSTDGSQSIAIANGARVIPVEQKGYGSALLGGFAAAQGKFIVMGDSDSSYDFGDIPKLIAKLEEGNDLVLGNRFSGGIQPDAMPWHHRYIGNPILSGLGRLLYRTPCRDWHCGLRAFDREKMIALQLQSTGMEFASEMVLRASQSKLRMEEVPTTLRPDGRDRPPHLRSVRDGSRHLALLIRFKQPSFNRVSLIMVAAFTITTFLIGLYALSRSLKVSRGDDQEKLPRSSSKNDSYQKDVKSHPWKTKPYESLNIITSDEADSLSNVIATIRERLRLNGPTNLSALTHFLLLFGPHEKYKWTESLDVFPIDILANRSVPDDYEFQIRKTLFGARFPLNREQLGGLDQSNTEAHSGQTVASLACEGVTLETVISSRPFITLRDVVEDLKFNVSEQGEVYWEYLSIALYSQKNAEWSDKYGKIWSVDKLANILIERDASDSPCGGTHGLITLAIISNVDIEHQLLHPNTSRRLKKYLENSVKKLVETELPEGGWDLTWHSPMKKRGLRTADETIMVTGHHLEWIMLLPAENRPSNELIARAVLRLVRLLDIHTADPNWVVSNYCPAVHATHSISLIVERAKSVGPQ
ncbi:MAG: glycosyltransferase family 2 protein, partial [Pirellula sp.]